MKKTLIVLLTDFGTRDIYAGVMKGVILGLFPGAKIVDLTHEIEPQNIQHAAFALEAASPHFPAGTIFVSVVDPGVGSRRKILAAKTRRAIFLAPDNGLLTCVLEKEKNVEIRAVTNRKFFLNEVSSTFHGRDCFAPAAARLAQKPSLFETLGPRLKRWKTIILLQPTVRRGTVQGNVVYFDRFGNSFSNISKEGLQSFGPRTWKVQLGGRVLGPIRSTYEDVKKGQTVPLWSSSGYLEIAVNLGSAREKWKIKEGMPVHVTPE